MAAEKKQKTKASFAKVASKLKNRHAVHKQASPHKSFRITRKSELPKLAPIPNWWKLFRQTLRLVFSNARIIFSLIGIYIVFAWLFTGAYSSDFGSTKEIFNDFSEGILSSIEQAGLLFSEFLRGQTESIDAAALILINIFSVLSALSFIWVARYAMARKKTTVREALYTSGAAFVPVVLLLLLVVIQLMLGALAIIIYANISGSGFIQGPLELTLFGLLAVLFALLSAYFITGSFIALQIAALPGMYPWRALQNARSLILGRRLNVLRKMVMLVVILLFLWVVILGGAILLDNAICNGATCWSTITLLPFVYFFLIAGTIAIVAIYGYVLYRSLLEAHEQHGTA